MVSPNQDVSREVTHFEIEKLAKAIECFRNNSGEYTREIPVQVIATFLYVASHDDCNKIDMERALCLSSASGSRNTDWLSDQHRLGKPGLRMVYRKPGETSKKGHKYQHVFLTEKGKETAILIRKILYPHT